MLFPHAHSGFLSPPEKPTPFLAAASESQCVCFPGANPEFPRGLLNFHSTLTFSMVRSRSSTPETNQTRTL